MAKGQRSTPQGEHRPVLLAEVLDVLQPFAGALAVDATVGFAGHALPISGRLGPSGTLLAIDRDRDALALAERRLSAAGCTIICHHGNFAGLPQILTSAGMTGIDLLLADLGMSSLQLDEPARGFSYSRPGPLDMRMDVSRGKTAAALLGSIDQAELARALLELGDEPDADVIAKAIVAARGREAIATTEQLVSIIMQAKEVTEWRLHPGRGRWITHPAARTFQALRILVNRELENLRELLRVAPSHLQSGGRLAVISFHSGEDRLIKAALKSGLADGAYSQISPEPIRAGQAECLNNPRSRSAKLRWAQKS